MPSRDPALQRERKRRAKLFFILTIPLSLVPTLMTAFWLLIYGFSLFFVVPFSLLAWLLGFFGSAFIVSQFLGFYTIIRPIEKDPFNPINRAIDLKEDTRMAVIMPIYHEDARSVAGGLSAMIEELSHHKEAKHFDWFVLSDSRKEDVIVQEQKAVFLLKEMFPDVGIHYRHRIMNTFAKVGNVSDFFRRWGNEFKAAVTLDADGIMPAETMITLARTMEGNDNVGSLQSSLRDIGSRSFFGRWYSFQIALYVPLTLSAESYLRLGGGYYYGHHGIIRSEAYVKHATLPILPVTKRFNLGKTNSHDIMEAYLYEGAGWETYILPQLVGFDQQVHSFIEYTIRENRWAVGSLVFFSLWRYKNFSLYGKLSMLNQAIGYANPLIGLIGIYFSFYSAYYMLEHPLIVSAIIARYKVIFLFSVLFLVAPILFPYFLMVTYHKKKGSLKKVGGVAKFTFSYFFQIFLGLFLNIVKTFLMSKIFLQWCHGTKLTWQAQDREYRDAVPWEECFKFTWYIVATGLAFSYFTYCYIYPDMNFSFAFSIVFVFCVISLISMLFSPVIVRLTSRAFPWMERMQWMKHEWEGVDEPVIMHKTREMTAWFKEQIAEDWSFEQALSDPYFALRHLAQCPSRPQKYAFWKDKLAGRNIQDLTRLEKLVVFRCRELWEMFMTKNLNVAQEKQQ